MKTFMCVMLFLSVLGACASSCASAESLQWMNDYLGGLERARVERKPVMIDFYTSWCYYCKVLDAKTYTDPEVVKLSEKFVCLKINAERERGLARRYRIAAYPIIVFLNRDGTEKTRLYGYQTPAALRRTLDSMLDQTERIGTLSDSYKKRPSDPEAGYLYADALMAAERFKEAEEVLRKVLKNRQTERRRDALLDLAICNFRRGDYGGGALGFAKFLGEFRESERADEATLFYGMCLVASGKKREGLKHFEELRAKIPDKWVGREAARQIELNAGAGS